MLSLTSQSCGDSLLAVCLAGQVGVIYRPPEHPWMPDRPVNEASQVRIEIVCVQDPFWQIQSHITLNSLTNT